MTATPAPATGTPAGRGPAAASGQKTGTHWSWPDDTNTDLRHLTGLAAAGFSALYVIADLIEVAQGGFSTFRLVLTYLAEAAIPLFVLGLYALQRPRIGRLGLAGAVAYAYSYVFFTATVVYALAAGTPNWHALGKVFGPWMTVHGLIMVAGGLAFGLATLKAGSSPAGPGYAS